MLQEGPVGVFTGPMSTTINRLATKIEIITDAVFNTLIFRFDAGEGQQVNANTLTYPAGHFIILREVQQFKLTSGSILVHFAYAKS